MSPGLPGIGIGGLFYILIALWMPIRELVRPRHRDRPGQWRLVATQFAIAVGIMGVMSAAFWALDVALDLGDAAGAQAGTHGRLLQSFRAAALLITLGVLCTVLGIMHALRVWTTLIGAQRT
jgi:hypothetical protein